MADFEIIEVDLEGTDASVYEAFLGTVFDPQPAGHLHRMMASANGHPSLHLAAIDHSGVIGFSSFISHVFRFGGKPVQAYQAAGVATSTARRGHGIFPAIVRRAEDLLRSRGVGLIFGYPNEAAYPVWTKKLGYREVALAKWRAPALPLLRKCFIRETRPSEKLALLQDDAELIEMKRRIYGEKLVVVEQDDSLLWGVRRELKRAGLTVPLLHVGGVRIGTVKSFRLAFKRALHGAGNPLLVGFDTVAGNPLAESFVGVKEVPTEKARMIVGDLNFDSSQTSFGIFSGTADTF